MSNFNASYSCNAGYTGNPFIEESYEDRDYFVEDFPNDFPQANEFGDEPNDDDEDCYSPEYDSDDDSGSFDVYGGNYAPTDDADEIIDNLDGCEKTLTETLHEVCDDAYHESIGNYTTPLCYGPDPQEIRAPKKTTQCHDFAYEVIAQLGIRVFEGENILRYDQEAHCFKQEKSLLPYIPEVLADATCKFSIRELKEIEGLILINRKIFISADELNCESSQINTQGGVLDWTRLEVYSHSRQDRFTYCVNASYQEKYFDDLSTPTFDAFCQTSLEGDEKKRQFLLELLGYCLSDCTGAKCAFFLKGAPDSGKSVMLEFISRLLAPSVISSVPFHKLHDRFNRGALLGRKINVAGEIKGKSLNEISTFKSITGGDQIEAEFKGKDVFFFTPRCKLVFAGNTLPGTSESDATAAFANRLAVLLFNKSIPKEEQDKQLLDKLMEERDDIFTKAVYALRNLRDRNYAFDYPADTLEFLEDFKGRHNSIEGFLDECCDRDPGSFVPNVALYATYVDYCTKNGLDVFSRNKLYEALSAIPGVRGCRERVGGKNLHGHHGLKIVP